MRGLASEGLRACAATIGVVTSGYGFGVVPKRQSGINRAAIAAEVGPDGNRDL